MLPQSVALPLHDAIGCTALQERGAPPRGSRPCDLGALSRTPFAGEVIPPTHLIVTSYLFALAPWFVV